MNKVFQIRRHVNESEWIKCDENTHIASLLWILELICYLHCGLVILIGPETVGKKIKDISVNFIF